MKRSIFIFACVLVLASCGSKNAGPKNDKDSTKTTLQYFGDTITEDNAMQSKDLMAFMADKDSAQVKFSATIKEVCQKKGCWMDVECGDQTMSVNFKDYSFFMPKDAGGKTAIMEGYCYKTVESVDWLKHKAKDANKSQAAIDSITEPNTTYAFTANGVIIK